MSKIKAKAKAENLPPVGTRWGYVNGMVYGWWEVRHDGLKFLERGDRWVPARPTLAVLESLYTRVPPAKPPKPARDSMAMRRNAVHLARVGCVGYSSATVKLVRQYKGGLIGTVEFRISKDGYAKFLADPTCGGAAT